jgi:hypothetical protein
MESPVSAKMAMGTEFSGGTGYCWGTRKQGLKRRMFSSWEFWLMILLIAIGVGILLTWIERRSEKKTIIGRPANNPTQLITALTSFFESQDNVNVAYLAQIVDGRDGKPPHPIIGIDADDDFQRIQKEAGKIAIETLEVGEIVDIIPVGLDKVSEYMKTQTQPFYEK